MTKATFSGIALTEQDAAVVKGMLSRGDRQHDIAAWFGVNGGRVADIHTGKTFPLVSAVHHGLPPPDPYLSGKSAHEAKQILERTISDLLDLAQKLDQKLAALG